MEDKLFLNAEDVASYMEISKSMAYKIIRQLNDELEADGFIVVHGKVNKSYFMNYLLNKYRLFID